MASHRQTGMGWLVLTSRALGQRIWWANAAAGHGRLGLGACGWRLPRGCGRAGQLHSRWARKRDAARRALEAAHAAGRGQRRGGKTGSGGRVQRCGAAAACCSMPSRRAKMRRVGMTWQCPIWVRGAWIHPFLARNDSDGASWSSHGGLHLRPPAGDGAWGRGARDLSGQIERSEEVV